MPRLHPAVHILVTLSLAASLSGQQQQARKPQTARQALLEMLTGDEQAVSKHLTVEVQQTLKQGKDSSGSVALGTVAGFRGLGLNTANQETFETGSVLLSMQEPRTHERIEVHVDSDDLAGDEDRLQLSLHALRDGQEVDTGLEFISQIEVAMLKQEGIWRLNTITVSAKLPVGDPKLMEKLTKSVEGGGMVGAKLGAHSSDNAQDRPKPDAEQTVRMLSMAEGMYANMHPEAGFTCSLSDLVNQSGSMLSALGIDPAITSGNFNGYKFSVSGCQGTPAATFQMVAEPITPSSGAKAFCSDATHNVRTADDGRGSTCLTSGKFRQNRTGLATTHVELQSK